MSDTLTVIAAFAILILAPTALLALFILEANLEDRLLRRADPGPRPAPPRAPPPDVAIDLRHARCPVCTTAIDREDLVVCRRCATPHHADCWRYIRRCSTFACGERQSAAP